MAVRLFWTIVLVSLAVQVAAAQDPTKVEPAHYKLDFENERVQVVSVHYGPHEKSAMHEHPGGVVVVINGGHLLFTDEKGKVREVYAKAGEARWFPPFRHRVENVGNTAYDAVYVGIKGMPGSAKGVAEVGGAAGAAGAMDLKAALSATGDRVTSQLKPWNSFSASRVESYDALIRAFAPLPSPH